jgi:hypothetical protein
LKNNNQQTMVCPFDAVENGGANEEGEQRGGIQRGGSAKEPILTSTKLVGRLDNDDDKNMKQTNNR